MNPAVLEEVARLRAQGVISGTQADFFGRVAGGRLVSVRLELQIALWAGVTLISGGAALLVRENLERLGPVTIGAGIGLAAALCLWYVARIAPPFSRDRVASPTLAFDYVLLLGVLLVGTDLAWFETQLTVLGPSWPWHLLLLSLIQLAFAFRHDSRAVLSLALASFAAWRGISLSLAGDGRFGAHDDLLRLNALLAGAIFLGAGLLLRRAGIKAHFEPTFGNLGLLLLLGPLVAGSFSGRGGSGTAWLLGLAAVAAAALWLSFRARRSDYFAQSVIAAFLGFLRLAAELRLEAWLLHLVSGGSLAALLLIVWAHRRFKEKE